MILGFRIGIAVFRPGGLIPIEGSGGGCCVGNTPLTTINPNFKKI